MVFMRVFYLFFIQLFFRSFLLKEVKGIDSWLEAIIGLALSCSFDGKL